MASLYTTAKEASPSGGALLLGKLDTVTVVGGSRAALKWVGSRLVEDPVRISSI